MRRRVANFWAMALCLAVLAGFAGALHPVGDTLSLFRLPLGLLCALTLFWRGPRLVRFALVGAATLALSTTLSMMLMRNEGTDLTVYSKNLWFANKDVSAVVADIMVTNPDIILLQEVSFHNNTLLDHLQHSYPYQHLCPYSGWSGIAVLSKRPLTASACSQQRGVALAKVAHPDGAFWAASIHLNWPYPYRNMDSAQAVADLLAHRDAPVVMGGDFNIFPWTASVRRIRRAAGNRLAGPARPSFSLNGAPLLLDHIYAPGGGSAELRSKLGSDHKGVLAQVNLRP